MSSQNLSQSFQNARSARALAAPVTIEVEPQTASNRLLSERALELALRHRYKLFAILLVIYLLGFNGQWRIEADSALYLGIARNLARDNGYVFRSHANHLAFPGPPLLFALSFKLAHSDTPLPALILMLLIAAATLALTYRLFLLHSGQSTAVLMTFGLGISRLFYRYSMELLSDMPFLFGVMAFLAGYEAILHRSDSERDPTDGETPIRGRWYDWVLLLGGLGIAVIMRPAMWGLLAAIVFSAVFTGIRRPSRRTYGHNRMLPAILIGLAAIGMAATFWLLDPRRRGGRVIVGGYEDALLEVKLPQFKALLWEIVHQNVPRLFDASGCQALFGCRIGPVFNELAGAVVLVIGVMLLRDRLLWGLWFIFTVLMMLVAVKPLDRYFLEVLPLVIYGWWRMLCWMERRISQPWGSRILAALLVTGATTNLLRVGEMILEQRVVPFRQYYKNGQYAATEKVVRLIKAQVGPSDWVLAPPKFGRILSFLSDRNVTEPSSGISVDPRRQTVYVLEPLDEPVRQWLSGSSARLGRQVGPTVEILKPAQETWRLRAVIPTPTDDTQE